jgi:hypothetical protein
MFSNISFMGMTTKNKIKMFERTTKTLSNALSHTEDDHPQGELMTVRPFQQESKDEEVFLRTKTLATTKILFRRSVKTVFDTMWEHLRIRSMK